jgi:hypothetical protein
MIRFSNKPKSLKQKKTFCGPVLCERKMKRKN